MENDFETLQSIEQWFKAAVPNPTIESACIQAGCHFEEIYEMVDEIMRGSYLSKNLANRANDFKTKLPHNMKAVELIAESDKRKLALLDSLCDQIVTAVGLGYMLGFDMRGALQEVNRSNWSKFVDGKPVFNENGKIAKGSGYMPPELGRFAKADTKENSHEN